MRTVLLRQVYIRDGQHDRAKTGQPGYRSLGENVIIRRIVRWELGEASGE